MPRPIGVFRIGGGEYVPTPEQEAQGLTAEHFEDLVPNLLQRTPPAVRRRLLEERGIKVPSDLIASTAQLAEFQRDAAPGGEREPVATAAAHDTGSEREKGAAEHAHALGEEEPATRKGTETAELPLVDAIVVLLSKDSHGQWSGTCSELLVELGRHGRATTEAKWPGTPQQLGTALRRHKEDLERLDIGLLFRREGKSSTRLVTLRRRVELSTDAQRNPVPELKT